MKNHLSYRFMPMIILSYLFINLYLIMIGSSWCESEGCEVSKSLLNIEQTDLYTLAIIAFGVLLFLGLKILKTDSVQLKEYYKLGVFSILICETILLSYLYFKTGTLCISCSIFYILVLINYLIIDSKDKKLFLIVFILVTMGLLKLDVNTTVNESIQNKYTLLQSPECKHCKEVKEYLEENTIAYMKKDYSLYSGLFSSLNITKIPVLIVKNNENSFLILNGVSEIKSYLEKNELEEVSLTTSKTSTQNNNFSLEEQKDGCEMDFLKKELENCEK